MDNAPVNSYPPPKPTSGLIAFYSIVFLIIGIVLGLVLAGFYPQVISITRKPCTPRPACLDAIPRCLIPETPDMCPPAVTPTPKPTGSETVVSDELNRYRVSIPSDWKVIEHSSKFQNTNQFQAPDGSILSINILDSDTESLTDFLNKKDISDQTSWEGKPGIKIQSSEKTIVAGLPAVRRIEDWLAADFVTINTYTLVNNQVYSFYIVPLEIPYDETDAYAAYQSILASFEPLNPASSYTCPKTEWIGCMPSPNSEPKPECQQNFLQWATANCPGFKGAAL